jgi:hypothetical protein
MVQQVGSDAEELRHVVAAAIQRYGLRETARRLDVAESSAARLAAGAVVRTITTRHARSNLAALLEG